METLVPGLLAWGIASLAVYFGARLSGNGLCDHIDSPALAERVDKHRGRLRTLVITSALGTLLINGVAAAQLDVRSDYFYGLFFPVLFLLAMTALAGDFPVRRRVFEEQWGIVEFLGHWSRIAIVMFGHTVAMLSMPMVIGAFDMGYHWLAAGVAGVVMLAWNWSYTWLFPRILGGKRLGDERLLKRFQEVSANSHAPWPRVWVFGSDRGRHTNAWAVPNWTRGAVVISRPLLDLLDEEEAAAMFAHETAHLEQFNHRLLGRLILIQFGMIILGSFAFAAMLQWHPGLASGFQWLWIILQITYLIGLERMMIRLETDGDTRAVELCGNGGAMIRALIKMHNALRQPRRMDAAKESSSTHPSLARRIQDIRSAMKKLGMSDSTATSGPRSGDGEVFVSRMDPNSLAVFTEDSLLCLKMPAGEFHYPRTKITASAITSLRNRASECEELRYDTLEELRLDVGDSFSLEAKGNGKMRSFALRPEDEGRIQAALDRVDDRLVSIEEIVKKGSSNVGWAGFLLMMSALFGQGIWNFGVTFCILVGSVLALSRKTSHWAAAVGLMAIASLPLPFLMKPYERSIDGFAWAAWLILGFSGTLMLWSGLRERLEKGPGRAALLYLLAGSFLLLFLTSGTTYDLGLAGVFSHLSRQSPDMFLPFVGAAGACFCSRMAALRMLGIGCLAVGLSHYAAGTQWWLSEMAKDPLAAKFSPAEGVPLEPSPVHEINLPDTHLDLSLSPDGTRYFTRFTTTNDNQKTGHQGQFNFQIGNFESGTSNTATAIGMRFMSNRQLLILSRASNIVSLALFDSDNLKTPSWELTIDGFEKSNFVELSAADSAWQIDTFTRSGEARTYAGEIGTSDFDIRHAVDRSRIKAVVEDGFIEQEFPQYDHGRHRPKTYRYQYHRSGETVARFSSQIFSALERSHRAGRALIVAFDPSPTYFYFDTDALAPKPFFRLPKSDIVRTGRRWNGSRLLLQTEARLFLCDSRTDEAWTLNTGDFVLSSALADEHFATLESIETGPESRICRLQLFRWPTTSSP